MKFKTEIEIPDDILQVLADYNSGISIDSRYIIENGFELFEHEGLSYYFNSGFYDHYPLYPNSLGEFMIEHFNKSK